MRNPHRIVHAAVEIRSCKYIKQYIDGFRSPVPQRNRHTERESGLSVSFYPVDISTAAISSFGVLYAGGL